MNRVQKQLTREMKAVCAQEPVYIYVVVYVIQYQSFQLVIHVGLSEARSTSQ